MLFKFFLLLIVLFLTYGLVVWLLKRLTHTTQQIAELHSQLARNDEMLAAKIAALQEQKQATETQEADAQNANIPASTPAPKPETE